mmetsp:Transcript_63316/g.162900  ORF Transcript_63316/g.162900 Transcript_63316/m.162900 type:complete len:200 (+) Transcript_63316:184-783(+)
MAQSTGKLGWPCATLAPGTACDWPPSMRKPSQRFWGSPWPRKPGLPLKRQRTGEARIGDPATSTGCAGKRKPPAPGRAPRLFCGVQTCSSAQGRSSSTSSRPRLGKGLRPGVKSSPEAVAREIAPAMVFMAGSLPMVSASRVTHAGMAPTPNLRHSALQKVPQFRLNRSYSLPPHSPCMARMALITSLRARRVFPICTV